MESTPDYRDELLAAERGAAAPYIDYPRLGAWYPLVTGGWAAALTATETLLGNRRLLQSGAILALVALELGFVLWYRRERGTTPRLRGVPREIAREMRRFAAVCVLVLAVVVAAAWLVSPWAAIPTAFLLVSVAVAGYEQRYAVAAAATRARLR